MAPFCSINFIIMYIIQERFQWTAVSFCNLQILVDTFGIILSWHPTKVPFEEQRQHYRGEVVYNEEDDHHHFPTLTVWRTLQLALVNPIVLCILSGSSMYSGHTVAKRYGCQCTGKILWQCSTGCFSHGSSRDCPASVRRMQMSMHREGHMAMLYRLLLSMAIKRLSNCCHGT